MALDEVILSMLRQESDRLGGSPSADDLAVIVERAFDISRQKNKALQIEGIERARQRDITLGRPRKQKPKNWPDVRRACAAGTITKEEACQALGISRSTLFRWLKE